MPDDQPRWITDALRAIGDRVRVRRHHLAMTQEALSFATDLSRSTIQRMETGEEIKMSHLLRVAHALRCHVTDLLH